MTQYQGGGQEAKRKDLVAGNPQKLTACFLSPTLAIIVRACWHEAPSKPSSIPTEIPRTHTVRFPVGMSTGVCALLTNNALWVRISASQLL